MKKLLLFGPSSIHLSNYLEMVEDYFDDVLVISDGVNNNIKKYRQELISFSIKNPLSNLKKISKIRALIKEFDPSVIHLHNIGTGAYLLYQATKKTTIPKIATAWGSDILVAPGRSLIFKSIVKNVLGSFTYFTSDSLFMAYEMEKLAKKSLPIQIANFGVDSVEVDLAQKENIIYSNRLHESLYRIDLIIDLFFDFIDRNNDLSWKLVVAATGSQTESLKAKVASHKYGHLVEFVGWIDKHQNAAWYQKAKIYISIPKSDATSISLLEAMENGCLPIVSNLPANLEWITLGYNGIIYQFQGQHPFEEALQLNHENVLTINRAIIKENGLKSSNKEKFLKVYNQVLSN